MAAPLKRARFDTDAPHSSEASPPISGVSSLPRGRWQTQMPSAVSISVVELLDFKERHAFRMVSKDHRAAVIQCGHLEVRRAEKEVSTIATALRTNSALIALADEIERILPKKNNPLISHERRMLWIMASIHTLFTGRIGVHPLTPYTSALHGAFKAELIGAIDDMNVIRLFLSYFGGAAFRLASLSIKSTPEYVLEATRFCCTALEHVGATTISSNPVFERELFKQAAVYHPHLMRNQVAFAALQKQLHENPLFSSEVQIPMMSVIRATQPAVDVVLFNSGEWIVRESRYRREIWPQHEPSELECAEQTKKGMRLEPDMSVPCKNWHQLLRYEAEPFPGYRADPIFLTDLVKHPYLRSATLHRILPEHINEQFLLNLLENPLGEDKMLYLIEKMRDPRTHRLTPAMTDNVQVGFLCLGRGEDSWESDDFEKNIGALYPGRSLPNYSVILRAFFSYVEKEQISLQDNWKCTALLEAFLDKQLPTEADHMRFDQIFADGLDPYADERGDPETEGWACWPLTVAAVLNHALRSIQNPQRPESKKIMVTLLADTLAGRADTLKGFLMALKSTKDKRT